MLKLIDTIVKGATSSLKSGLSVASSSRSKRRTLLETGSQLRAEPLCIVSDDISNMDIMPSVKKVLTTVYASLHMIALSAMMIDPEKADIVKVLDNLSPQKNIDSFIRSMESHDDYMYTEEAYSFGLPFERPESVVNTTEDITFSQSSVFKDHPTGIMVDVGVTIGDTKSTLGLAYLLRAQTVKTSHAISIMSHSPIRRSTLDSLYKLKNRGGSYIDDMLIGKELIARKQRMLMEDSSGTYEEIQAQVRAGHAFSVFSGTFNPVTASSIYVVSKDAAKEVERVMGGKLSNPKIREKIFDNSLAMIIAIVDYEWDSFTVYYSGIGAPTVSTLSSLGKKAGDLNILDLFKTLKGGNAAII